MAKDSYSRIRKSNPQSLNQYAYCNNNPITNVDPNGDSWFTAVVSAVVSHVTSAVVSHITSGQTHYSNSSSNTLVASTDWALPLTEASSNPAVLAPLAPVAAFFTTYFSFARSTDLDPSETGLFDEDSTLIIQDSDKPWYSLPGSLKERKFPGEYKDSTWREIQDNASNGNVRARTAKKIIEQGKRIRNKSKYGGNRR